MSFTSYTRKKIRKFVANAAWLSIAFAAVMTVVVCVLCRQILSWMDTPENIFERLVFSDENDVNYKDDD